jgi:hypothetical protein
MKEAVGQGFQGPATRCRAFEQRDNTEPGGFEYADQSNCSTPLPAAVIR